MSKKRFKSGLESLFGADPEIADLQDGSPLLVETEEKQKTAPTNPKKKKKRSTKNFTSDLDSLFEDVFNSEPKVKVEARTTGKSGGVDISKKKTHKPIGGLDMLIRQTLEGSEVEVNYQKRKRVTFVFDKHKFEKLKKIAKKEKRYLKDIIGKVVSTYIQEYEDEKGAVE